MRIIHGAIHFFKQPKNLIKVGLILAAGYVAFVLFWSQLFFTYIDWKLNHGGYKSAELEELISDCEKTSIKIIPILIDRTDPAKSSPETMWLANFALERLTEPVEGHPTIDPEFAWHPDQQIAADAAAYHDIWVEWWAANKDKVGWHRHKGRVMPKEVLPASMK